jgi:hypothetical protein
MAAAMSTGMFTIIVFFIIQLLEAGDQSVLNGAQKTGLVRHKMAAA